MTDTNLARVAGEARAYSKHYINGEWVPSSSKEFIDVIDPSNGETFATVPSGNQADVETAVTAARNAFEAWSLTLMSERIDAVNRLIDCLTRESELLAQTLVAEMGSPIGFARGAQVGVAIADLRALVAAAESHVAAVDVSNSLVVTEAIGVVAAITPWNFPLHQIALKVGAALLAGCTVVLKPSEVAPVNAIILTELMHELKLPAGVFNLLLGDGLQVGEPLTSHPGVDFITFTGSRDVGQAVMQAAAPTIKKVALELGGKSAAIILDDAPLAEAVEQVLSSCFANAGQTCAALTRVLVPVELQAEFERLVVKKITKWAPNEPSHEGTMMGPLASARQLALVEAHVQKAIAQGARVIASARLPEMQTDGAYFAPRVLGNVSSRMAIFHEEVFGPVLVVVPYEDLDEAVSLANDSIFGLGGGVWSASYERAVSVAKRLRVGTVGINGAGLDVGAPFGGYKQSGIGREGGSYGLEEFLEVKTIMGGQQQAPETVL